MYSSMCKVSYNSPFDVNTGGTETTIWGELLMKINMYIQINDMGSLHSIRVLIDQVNKVLEDYEQHPHEPLKRTVSNKWNINGG